MAAGDNGLAALLEAFGVKNKSVGTDRSNELAAWGNLKNIANTTAGAGGDATAQALKYFTSILSGSPTAVQSAVAPTTNAVAAQQAAQGRQIASQGTARTGGINAEQQQVGDKARAATQTAINSAAPNASAILAQLGPELTGQSISASGTLGEQTEPARQYDQNRSDKEINALTQLLTQIVSAAGA
jgi:hypothetical protein